MTSRYPLVLSGTTIQELQSGDTLTGFATLDSSGLVPSSSLPILKISSVVYPGDDLAADPAGGQTVILNGSGFTATPTVFIDNTIVPSVTFISSTQISFVTPAKAAATYHLYVVNPDGSTCIKVNGLSYSGTPTWTTPAGDLGASAGNISIQLQATGDAPLVYTLTVGSTLPSGITLSSSGLLSGTVTDDQVFNFSVDVTDPQNQTTPRSFSVTIVSNDPYFKYNTLLISGDGVNAAQNNTFLDSSPNNFTITRNGNVAQGSFSPYGDNWSTYFNGSSYLSVADNAALEVGANNFTLEGWFYATGGSSNTDNIIVAKCSSAYAPYWVSYRGTTGQIAFCSSSTNLSWNIANNLTFGAVSLNTWNHFAISRSSNNIYCFLNGVLGATIAVSTTTLHNNSDPFTIGGQYQGMNPFYGYVSNVRLVNTAVYTANFTPPTTPLTAVVNTALLTCQSNRFIDKSTNNYTITTNGTLSIQKFSPFAPTSTYSAATNGGSAYFDGTGDYLIKTGTDTLSGNFTIEYWMYPTATGIYPTPFSNYNANATTGANALYVQFSLNSTTFWFRGGNGSADTQIATYTAKLNVWTHHAIVRSGSTVTAYVNGVSVGSITSSVSYPISTLGIGAYCGPLAGSYPFFGNISDFRVVNGTAVYTANFTPPTAPLTAIANTSLLANFTNAGIYDSAMMSNLETVGNAQVSTSVKKYGTGSLAFDGNGDRLVAPSNSIYSFGTGDFTIECWINPDSQPGTWNSFIVMPNAGPTLSLYGAGTSSQIWFNSYGSGDQITANYTFTIGNWVHVAFVRSNGTLSIYLNGILAASGAKANNYAASKVVIGSDDGGQQFNGYIDDLRITKGYARYTANFTPPTAAHKLK